MSGFLAPGVKAKLDRLARQAVTEGSWDAALMLAREAPCKDFSAFIKRFVPADERRDVGTIDLLADARARVGEERASARRDRAIAGLDFDAKEAV